MQRIKAILVILNVVAFLFMLFAAVTGSYILAAIFIASGYFIVVN